MACQSILRTRLEPSIVRRRLMAQLKLLVGFILRDLQANDAKLARSRRHKVCSKKKYEMEAEGMRSDTISCNRTLHIKDYQWKYSPKVRRDGLRDCPRIISVRDIVCDHSSFCSMKFSLSLFSPLGVEAVD